MGQQQGTHARVGCVRQFHAHLTVPSVKVSPLAQSTPKMATMSPAVASLMSSISSLHEDKNTSKSSHTCMCMSLCLLQPGQGGTASGKNKHGLQ